MREGLGIEAPSRLVIVPSIREQLARVAARLEHEYGAEAGRAMLTQAILQGTTIATVEHTHSFVKKLFQEVR